MSSLDGHFQEGGGHSSIDHNLLCQISALLAYDNCRDLSHVCNVLFRQKINLVLPTETCPFLVLPRNVMLQHTKLFNFHSIEIICQVVNYRRIKTTENLKHLALRSHSYLKEVVAYKRLQI